MSAEWHRYESLFGARVRDELPHASCVEVGGRTFRENNAVQVAGLDRIRFWERPSSITRQPDSVP